MFGFGIRGSFLLLVMGLMSQTAHAEDDMERCISRQHQPTGVELSRMPAAVHGLEPLVSLPSEGHLRLHSASSDCCSNWPSPGGDLTFLAGPYDPVNRRLYIWGFDRNGWIEVVEAGGTWDFGESGTIEPRLYEPSDDIEDVTVIERSEILGVQFYNGYTAPHWLTGSQSYRVYQISGPEVSRVPELEAGRLDYVGDDLAAGFAVFAPAGASWGRSPELFVWYDGTGVVIPSADLPPLMGFCR